MIKDVLMKTGLNLYLLGLALPLGGLIGLALLPLWMFSFAVLLSYHAINLYIPISKIFVNVGLHKLPQYFGFAYCIYVFAPFGISGSLLTLTVLASPLVVDLALIGFTIGVALLSKAIKPNASAHDHQIRNAVIQGTIDPFDDTPEETPNEALQEVQQQVLLPVQNNWWAGIHPWFAMPLQPPRQPARRQDLHVEDKADNDLRGFMQRGVYAPQNNRQKTALEEMQSRYKKRYNLKGEAAIFAEIESYIRAEYDLKPAKLFDITLPLSLGKWGFLTWLMENTPFYKNTAHTAYRFLFTHPNYWRAPKSFENNLNPENKTKIAYMWLAATAKNQKLPEGQTRESLLNEFMQAIYDLGRAHNYNRTRKVPKKRKDPVTQLETQYLADETYDNLMGDQCTCNNGINQRVTQFYMVFLNDRPETRPMTPDLIRKKFQEDMIDESKMKSSFYNKLKSFDKATIGKLETALTKKYVLIEDIQQDEQEVIGRLAFTEKEVGDFVKECEKYYGPVRVAADRPDDQKIHYQHHRFKSYEKMIRHLANNAVEDYFNGIMRNITNLKAANPFVNEPGRILQFSNQSPQVEATNDLANPEIPVQRIGLTVP